MTKTTTSLSAAFALTLTLGLGACATEEPVDTGTSPAPTQPAVDTTDDADDAMDDGAMDDDAQTDDAMDDADETADGPAAVPPPADDLTAAALEAIDTAEAETGGVAYEIDDQDSDGSWEIDVRVDDRSVEVTVAEDGITVLGTEDDDLDDDDRAALDAATITLQEAINLAVEEVGGVLDDAELEDDNGTYYWEVSVDGTDRGDDVEVKVSVTGEILEIDD